MHDNLRITVFYTNLHQPRKKHDAIEIALKKHATAIAAKTCHLKMQKVATQSEKGVCLYLNMY